MINSRHPTKYWSRLFAGVILSFELGGRISDVVSVSAIAVEKVRTQVGERYSLFSDAEGRHPVWDCPTPIDIAVNLHQVSESQRPSLIGDIQEAIDDINESSYFTLRRIGTTNAVPTSSWGTDWRGYTPAAPVVIAFGSGTDTDLLPPGAAAVGGQFSSIDSKGQRRATAGWVYVDTRHLDDYPPGRGDLGRVGLFTHELLHVLGLGHVDSRQSRSIMTPRLSDSTGYLGAGDLAGLQRLEAISCSGDSP